ncbi:hypothetical protein L1887_32762 [Cichorium endivia]|nr:hypothetical protein L1887_32762 [Cichorium endivia]
MYRFEVGGGYRGDGYVDGVCAYQGVRFYPLISTNAINIPITSISATYFEPIHPQIRSLPIIINIVDGVCVYLGKEQSSHQSLFHLPPPLHIAMAS